MYMDTDTPNEMETQLKYQLDRTGLDGMAGSYSPPLPDGNHGNGSENRNLMENPDFSTHITGESGLDVDTSITSSHPHTSPNRNIVCGNLFASEGIEHNSTPPSPDRNNTNMNSNINIYTTTNSTTTTPIPINNPTVATDTPNPTNPNTHLITQDMSYYNQLQHRMKELMDQIECVLDPNPDPHSGLGLGSQSHSGSGSGSGSGKIALISKLYILLYELRRERELIRRK